MSVIKMRLEREFGISDPEHVGDGAYVGLTGEGIALFTTDGIEVTRPVYLSKREISSLLSWMKHKGVISRTE